MKYQYLLYESDEQLRALERKWLHTGNPEDEQNYLTVLQRSLGPQWRALVFMGVHYGRGYPPELSVQFEKVATAWNTIQQISKGPYAFGHDEDAFYTGILDPRVLSRLFETIRSDGDDAEIEIAGIIYEYYKYTSMPDVIYLDPDTGRVPSMVLAPVDAAIWDVIHIEPPFANENEFDYLVKYWESYGRHGDEPVDPEAAALLHNLELDLSDHEGEVEPEDDLEEEEEEEPDQPNPPTLENLTAAQRAILEAEGYNRRDFLKLLGKAAGASQIGSIEKVGKIVGGASGLIRSKDWIVQIAPLLASSGDDFIIRNHKVFEILKAAGIGDIKYHTGAGAYITTANKESVARLLETLEVEKSKNVADLLRGADEDVIISAFGPKSGAHDRKDWTEAFNDAIDIDWRDMLENIVDNLNTPEAVANGYNISPQMQKWLSSNGFELDKDYNEWYEESRNEESKWESDQEPINFKNWSPHERQIKLQQAGDEPVKSGPFRFESRLTNKLKLIEQIDPSVADPRQVQPIIDMKLWNQITEIIPHDPHDEPSPRLIGQIDNVKVYIVDGDLIRHNYYMDYVDGGHDLVYGPGNKTYPEVNFISPNTIWLDGSNDYGTMLETLYHEVIERRLMSQGMTYDEAHKIANLSERQICTLVGL